MDDLYREQILEHYKRPHNYGRPERVDLEFEDTNPFCGDEQHVFLALGEDGRVAEARFEGKAARSRPPRPRCSPTSSSG